MIKKIKNLFSVILKPSKKKIFLLSFCLLVLIGLMLPLQPAYAFVDRLIAGMIASLVFAITTIIILISAIPLVVSTGLLALVTTPGFFDINFATNDIVMTGWTLTRDLANMFFILVLVVIALATILRIGDYQAKKALPLLIIMALLINFTPVIANTIIGSFNIVMRFFLAEGTGADILVLGLEVQGGEALEMIRQIDFKDLGPVLVFLLISTLLTVIFNLIAAFTLFAFALLFFIRPIAFIILIILSPLAFLAYVLPATKSFWTQWWKQFFAWCMVGVIGSFFLWLIDQFAYYVVRLDPERGYLAVANGEIAAILAPFIPLLVIIIFMVFGLMQTLNTTAAGASHAINLANQAKRGALGVGKVAAGTWLAKNYHEKVAPKMWGRLGGMAGGLAKIAPGSWLARTAGKAEAGAMVHEEKERQYGKDKITNRAKELENLSPDRLAKLLLDTKGDKDMQASVDLALQQKRGEGREELELEIINRGIPIPANSTAKNEAKKRADDLAVESANHLRTQGLDDEAKKIECNHPELYNRFGMGVDSTNLPTNAQGQTISLSDTKKMEMEKIMKQNPDLLKNIDINAITDPDIKTMLRKVITGNMVGRITDDPVKLEQLKDFYKNDLDVEMEKEVSAGKTKEQAFQNAAQTLEIPPQLIRYFQGAATQGAGIADIFTDIRESFSGQHGDRLAANEITTRVAEHTSQNLTPERLASMLRENEGDINAQSSLLITFANRSSAGVPTANSATLNQEFGRERFREMTDADRQQARNRNNNTGTNWISLNQDERDEIDNRVRQELGKSIALALRNQITTHLNNTNNTNLVTEAHNIGLIT